MSEQIRKQMQQMIKNNRPLTEGRFVRRAECRIAA